MAENWIDVSVPLSDGMVRWPGDPPVRIGRVQDLEHGAAANVTHLDLGAHTGTHIDAPNHFLRGARSISEMPLDATIGPCRVIALEDLDSIGAEDLRPLDPRVGERLLIKSRNSRRRWEREPFDPAFVHLRAEAADFLAECRIRTLGVDYLSVGGYQKDGQETHLALLQAGIWVIEGLNLGSAAPGDYDLVCLPLLIPGADGAPARAVLRTR